MEKIINFTGPAPFKRKDRHFKQNTYLSEQSENSANEEENESMSPIYKKKSHFGKDKGGFLAEEKKLNMEAAFDTDDSEANTPKDIMKDLNNNFSKGASKNIHSKFRTATQVMRDEAEKALKTKIQGDVDNPEEELDSAKKLKNLPLPTKNFVEDKQDGSKKEVSPKTKTEDNKKPAPNENVNVNFSNNITAQQAINAKKKDHKTRFLTTINNGGINSDAETKNLEQKQEKIRAINNHPYRHLIFSPYVTESLLKKHLSITYRGLVYSVKCLKGPTEKFIKTKQVSLIDSKTPKRKTLLLDLDETLIHSCNLKENPQHILTAINEYGEKISLGINIRPFCTEFLKLMTEYYDIFVFTASSPNYANTIINYLDPTGKLINGILTRSNCMETKNGFFIKDLRIIKNRDLKNLIIVDNLSHSFGFQIENGVPILEWHNDIKDMELKYLVDYLIEAVECDDVRLFNKERLKLREMVNFKSEELGI